MMPIEIREATIDELQIVHELAKQIWEPTYRNIISKAQIDFMFDKMYTLHALIEQVDEKHHHFLIAYSQNAPVGFASYYFEEAKIIRVPKLYIHPSNQKQGIGKKLIEEIEVIGKGKSCLAIQLNVNRFNPAFHFYTNAGFSIIRTIDIPYFDFVLNDFVMERKIKS